MITTRIVGGLGNQLFQYSAAYALAKRLNETVLIDNSFFSERSLKMAIKNLNLNFQDIIEQSQLPKGIKFLKNKYINKALKMLHIRHIQVNDGWDFYHESSIKDNNPWFWEIKRCNKNVYMEGYFQREEYFNEYRDDLIKQFSPIYMMTEEYQYFADQIKNSESVAVHVRRGDFLKAQYNHNPHHYILKKSYYENALRYIYAKVTKPKIFWFSDDIEWVKENFVKEDFCYVKLHSMYNDIDEMLLMSTCNNVITANSTFSWWAAWMNKNRNAIVICPDKPYGNEHMIPKRWIKIGQ